jgi:uncharacterized membrane protein YfcA
VTDPIIFAAAVTATYLFAGFVKGAMGVGLPTIAMGLMSLLVAPPEAAAILVVPTLATNTWQVLAGPSLGRQLKRLWPLYLATVAGTFATIRLLTGASPLAAGAIGAVLAAYGAFGLASPRFAVPRRHEGWLNPLTGLATGLLGGATGISFIPAIPYLASLEIDKDDLIQAMGISAFVAALALGSALALNGRFHAGLAGSSLLALLPALAGMSLGRRVGRRLPVTAFRRWFLVSLAALGTYMLVRAFLRA